MYKNRIIYASVVIISLAFIYLYDDVVTYMAFYSVAILPLFSLVITLIFKRQFLLTERLQNDQIMKGESIKYYLTVVNRSLLPFSSVCVMFHSDNNAVVSQMSNYIFSISAFGKRELEFDLTCRFRGVFEVGVKEVVLCDMLGLFKFRQKLKHTLSITVYPKVSSVSNLPLIQFEIESVQHMQRLKSEDYSVISDLRQYTQSDSFKKIHWKMSAKKNEWIVKNYQSMSRNIATLIVDNTEIELDGTSRKKARRIRKSKRTKMEQLSIEKALAIEDRIMEAVVSVASYCTQAQYPLKLYYIGSDVNETVDALQFTSLYEEAAKISFDSNNKDISFADYLDNLSFGLLDFSNIIIFTKKLTEKACDKLLDLKIFGHNVIVVSVISSCEKSYGEYIKKLMEFGIVCLTIPLESENTKDYDIFNL